MTPFWKTLNAKDMLAYREQVRLMAIGHQQQSALHANMARERFDQSIEIDTEIALRAKDGP